MGCEQPVNITTAITEIYRNKDSEYLRKPETFVFGVVHDVNTMPADRPFWIKTFTEAGVAMMDEGKLEILIGKVHDFLETDEGMAYYPESCLEVLIHLKTIAEVRKISCPKSGPDDEDMLG